MHGSHKEERRAGKTWGCGLKRVVTRAWKWAVIDPKRHGSMFCMGLIFKSSPRFFLLSASGAIVGVMVARGARCLDYFENGVNS